MKWTEHAIPDLTNKVVIVTGVNSGLGYESVKAFAKKGAEVILASLSNQKGEEARMAIINEVPQGNIQVRQLDLGDLDSVRAFAAGIKKDFEKLDVLLNNAGIMMTPYFKTKDGFEGQFGTNHLGHFALTALLWDQISKAAHSRIVTVSSAAHHIGRIRFEDIHWEKKYSKWGAYGMSKLSNLLFTSELARRLQGAGLPVLALASHPGYASTELQTKGAKMRGSNLGVASFRLANRLVAQSAENGALPTLYAATSEQVRQGAYYGPDGFLRLAGWPAPDTPNKRRVSDEVAERLWKLSEQLTGCRIPV